jgi:hypothetical protein
MAAQGIKAQAVVEVGAFEVSDRIRYLPFLVIVSGELAETGDALEGRTYRIEAVDEPHAAFEGIDRYVLEMSRVN